MSYDEAQAWLFGLQGLGVKLGLENVHAHPGKLAVLFSDVRPRFVR